MVLLVRTRRIEEALEEYQRLLARERSDEGSSKVAPRTSTPELATPPTSTSTEVSSICKSTGSETTSTSAINQSISHTQLINVSSKLVSAFPDNPTYRLSQLIKGTSVFIPPKPAPPPKSKAFLEQMERLRNEEAEREYQNMINPEFTTIFSSNPNNKLSIGQEAKQLREQLSAIVNIFVSVVSVAGAIWYWSGSSAGYSITTRTLLSVFGALIILIAEVVVYVRYKIRIDEAKEIERKKKEEKVIVASTDISKELKVENVDVKQEKKETKVPAVRKRTNRKTRKV